MFSVELVWNREFAFVPYGRPFPTIEEAINYSRSLEAMGDGASVKKTRVLNAEGEVVWAYGKLVEGAKK